MSIHHCNAKEFWGSNNKNNLKTINNDYWHKCIHMLFSNMAPHMAINMLIKLIWLPIIDTVKEDINSIITVPDPYNLYKSWTIKNKQKFERGLYKNSWVERI